eukprot:TRINITY_DN79257_c0_g1_i1.p1 TRINITY_DN79257_c0_g1~~TRINITY_DN79257_c0_g1_i1.p1  ORF type:complete len:438 (+),score=83.15 TRINITY_DN79257_c0_g1_i1:42-1355(+)
MATKPKTVVVGGGIGGCTAAIALHHAGADVTIYESAPQLLEIGAGINVQAVAIGALVDLGIPVEKFADPAQGDGILTSQVEYYTNEGIFIAAEAVGLKAGASHPQMSVHRAKFHSTLVNECRRLLGEDRVILNSTFVGLEQGQDEVTVNFESSDTKAPLPPVTCNFLVGADGLKSRVRSSLLGDQEPRYTGRTIYRGLCQVDKLNGDGNTVSLCGDETGNFICYPISEGMRREGKFHCNWGFNATRPHPGGQESWTALAKVEDIREELELMSGNTFGGVTPLQMAERTEKIIGWALFDRDPLDSFDFGLVTLLGDSAHPLLPFGSQGATQAIMDAEALGVCYQNSVASGAGVRGCIKAYSDMRCEVTGKVVIANRDMGSTAVLRVVNEKCKGLTTDEKRQWCEQNGKALHDEVIQKYRASMPKSVRASPSAPGKVGS